MKNRVYLLMTVLLGILSFSQSEARIVDHSDGAQVSQPSLSVTIPLKNHPSTVRQMAFRGTSSGRHGNAQPGRISENESPLPRDRVNLPNQDTNQRLKRGKAQPDGEGMIFDRWGNL